MINEEVDVLPAPGWIFVRRDLPAEKTSGGIIIPEMARDRERGMQSGETPDAKVLAVGAGVEHVKKGDTVFCLVNHENFMPVITDIYQVQTVNGRPMPNFFLVKADAVAGTLRKAA